MDAIFHEDDANDLGIFPWWERDPEDLGDQFFDDVGSPSDEARGLIRTHGIAPAMTEKCRAVVELVRKTATGEEGWDRLAAILITDDMPAAMQAALSADEYKSYAHRHAAGSSRPVAKVIDGPTVVVDVTTVPLPRDLVAAVHHELIHVHWGSQEPVSAELHIAALVWEEYFVERRMVEEREEAGLPRPFIWDIHPATLGLVADWDDGLDRLAETAATATTQHEFDLAYTLHFRHYLTRAVYGFARVAAGDAHEDEVTGIEALANSAATLNSITQACLDVRDVFAAAWAAGHGIEVEVLRDLAGPVNAVGDAIWAETQSRR